MIYGTKNNKSANVGNIKSYKCINTISNMTQNKQTTPEEIVFR